LDEDAGAVAGVGLGTGRTAVVEPAQGPERRRDDVPAPPALDVDHERHATRVVLEPRVVEPRCLGNRAERRTASELRRVPRHPWALIHSHGSCDPTVDAEGRRWPGCE